MNIVILHGALAEQFGERHRYHVATPREALRALCANKPKFAEAICGLELRLVRSKPDVECGLELGEEDLEIGMSAGELHVIPVPAGSKRGGLGKIILGVALIAAVVITGGGAGAFAAGLAKGGVATGINAALVASGGASFLGISGSTVMLAGAALALGGAAMMLAPSPKNTEADQKNSFLFNNVGNTAAQGAAVPLVYGGPILTGSVVVGLGLSTEQVSVSTGAYLGGDVIVNAFGSGLLSGAGSGSFIGGEYGFDGTWDTYAGGGRITTTTNILPV